MLHEPLFIRLAEKYGKSTAQIILRWHIQEGTIVFPKSTNPQHLRENIDIFDFVLTQDEMQSIRKLDCGVRYFTMSLAQQEQHLGSFRPED
ncbi:MAG: aldo/keto reductase [Clostridium sp.]|nr:aldo/keto reductase [Clostridium sp.]